jgi:histone H3/H4
MEKFTKPSITRIARKAGVKNVSEDCYPAIRNIMALKIADILEKSFIVNDERTTKTLMVDDVLDSFRLNGLHLSKSLDLCKDTCKST